MANKLESHPSAFYLQAGKTTGIMSWPSYEIPYFEPQVHFTLYFIETPPKKTPTNIPQEHRPFGSDCSSCRLSKLNWLKLDGISLKLDCF